MTKLTGFILEAFPNHMGQGNQPPDAYLALNGWQKQEPQKGVPVWKCPVTGSNFMQPEALQRTNDRQFEERVIIIVKGQVKKNADLSAVAKDANARLEQLNKQYADLETTNGELLTRIGQLQDAAAKAATASTAAAPSPAPTPAPTGAAPAGAPPAKT